MRILILHNAYKAAGGEDSVVRQETALLQAHGHDVIYDEISNDAIASNIEKIRSFMQVTGSKLQADRIRALCAEVKPDIVHIHNFFPLLSPAAHGAARASGAAVVQTLHNYRLLCASALLMRSGQICEDCLGPSRLPAIRHKCYRGSYLGSLAVNRMIHATTDNPKWQSAVDQFIVLTEFGKRLFIRGGLPAEKLCVKPNFVADHGTPLPLSARDQGYVFLGRLSREKGIRTLVTAWNNLPQFPLQIIGAGPEEDWCRAHAGPHINLHGALPHDAAQSLLRRAKGLIFPSECYEGLSMSLLEGFAAGTPIVACDIGPAREILGPVFSDLLFTAGDAQGLAAAVLRFEAQEWHPLSHAARALYEAGYSPARNYTMMMDGYEKALAQRRARA